MLILSGGLGLSKTKLLEQPIPASYLKLEERVRQLAVDCKSEGNPPVIKETLFRDSTKDIIANPRELNQAVTFLHENGMYATDGNLVLWASDSPLSTCVL